MKNRLLFTFALLMIISAMLVGCSPAIDGTPTILKAEEIINSSFVYEKYEVMWSENATQEMKDSRKKEANAQTDSEYFQYIKGGLQILFAFSDPANKWLEFEENSVIVHHTSLEQSNTYKYSIIDETIDIDTDDITVDFMLGNDCIYYIDSSFEDEDGVLIKVIYKKQS